MSEDRRLRNRFLAFHTDNPHVYDKLLELALQWKRSGRTRLSVKMLWEVMRWQLTFETNDPDFKLNNDYHAYYVRWLDANPELHGMFQLRVQRDPLEGTPNAS